MNRIHTLKIQPEPFQAVLELRKRFEWVEDKEGAGYLVGDTLLLVEWDPGVGATGRWVSCPILYIQKRWDAARERRMVVMSFDTPRLPVLQW